MLTSAATQFTFLGEQKSLPVRVRRPRVLVLANGFSHAALGKGGGERNGLNDSAGDGVVWASRVHSEGTETMHRRRCPRRGLDWVFGKRHGGVRYGFFTASGGWLWDGGVLYEPVGLVLTSTFVYEATKKKKEVEGALVTPTQVASFVLPMACSHQEISRQSQRCVYASRYRASVASSYNTASSRACGAMYE